MMTASDFSASTPVAPTTAAIAPNAPTGAAHMIMDSTRKTRRWTCPMPRSTGSPEAPIAWRPKPTSSATSSVWSTWPWVSAETSVSGMMPSRKSVVDSAPPLVWAWPACRSDSVRCRPEPGSRMLPTTRPMASATVDITMK